jgi:TolA-binding protein
MSNIEQNQILEAENKKNKLNIITWSIVVGIVVIAVVLLITYMVVRNNNVAASVAFEKAYDKVLEFDGAPNIDSKQEMQKDTIDLLNKVIALYPNTTAGKRALFYKGHVLYFTGEYEKAEKIFVLFVDKYSSYYLADKAYYFLSYCYSENGKIDEAINILEKFVKKYKKSYIQPLALYRLGDLYVLKNNKDKAVEYYQSIIDKYSTSPQKVLARNKIALLKNDVKL